MSTTDRRRHHPHRLARILREPGQLVVLFLAVALLVVQGFVINRLAGIPYPTWRPAPPA